jgi:hypothetical protein
VKGLHFSCSGGKEEKQAVLMQGKLGATLFEGKGDHSSIASENAVKCQSNTTKQTLHHKKVFYNCFA